MPSTVQGKQSSVGDNDSKTYKAFESSRRNDTTQHKALLNSLKVENTMCKGYVGLAPTLSQRMATRIPVTKVHISSLWQPQVDICQDPVHGGMHPATNDNLDIAASVRLEMKIKMRTFHHRLLHNIRLFEGRLCPDTLEITRNHTIYDFIHTNHTSTGPNQELVTQLYIDVSRLVYIFSILNSDGARQCCIANPSIYFKLRNQVLPEVYNLVSGAILNWPIRSCTMSLTTTLQEPMTCEEVRNLIQLIYRYGQEQTERILQTI